MLDRVANARHEREVSLRRLLRGAASPTVLSLLIGAAIQLPHGASAEPPSTIDNEVVAGLREAREAKGVAAYVALQKIWRRWDQGEPRAIAEAFDAIEKDGRVAAPIRAYAGVLSAYAKRRRGDLDGAKRKLTEVGYVDDWMVVGPFDNDAKSSLNTAFGPETDLASPISFGRSYEGKVRPVAWRPAPRTNVGWIDLGELIRPAEKICAYTSTFVSQKQPSKAELAASVWVGASGSFRLWWNGVEVLADEAYREIAPDRLAARVSVKPGWNRLMVKVCGDDAPPMVQVRIADASGAPSPLLTWSSSIEHANEAATLATKPAAVATGGPGIKVVAPTKGDPYAHGAVDAKAGPSRVPAAFAGALVGLDAIVANTKAPADQTEAFARYLATTGGDDRAKHTSRDLAARVSEQAPTLPRLLLAAELAEDRNARAVWLEKARDLLDSNRAGDEIELLIAEALHVRTGLNPRASVPLLDRVLMLDPDRILAVLGRADLYNDAGLRQSSLATLERGIDRNPSSVSLLRAYAQQLRSVDRTTEAEEVEDRYAQYRFDDVSFIRGRIEIAVARRDKTAAFRWIDRLVAVDPESQRTVEFLSRMYRALGETPRAISALQRRLDAAPEDVETMRMLADIHGEDGKSEEQLKLLRKILLLRPQSKDIREYVESAEPPKVRRDEAFAFDKDQLMALAAEPRPAGVLRRTLRDLQVTTVYANGLSSRFHQIVFQPLTDAGAAQSSEHAFGFQADREVVDLRSVKVYRPNGKIDQAIETGQAAADDPSISMYTSARTFYVHLPRLEPGDVVELRYRIEDVTPRNDFGDSFAETAYLQTLEPTSSSEYVLLLPKSRQITLREPAGGLFTRTDSDEGDLHLTKLTGTNIPALVQEPNMPPLAERILSASASSFKSWDEVAAWYWGLAKDQLDVDSEVRRVVAEITKGLTDDKDKVRAVYDYVVQKTRYVALEFGIEGYRPRRCAQTLGRGWGDCKDKATLIVTMLRELGIPANLVLVRTNMRGAISSDPPSYALFDHAIAYVPKYDIFLDGTAEYTGMNELPSMDQGALAFVVSEGGTGKLVNLPISPASASTRSRKIELTLNDGGPAGLDFKMESSGSFASEGRQRYHAVSTQRTRLIEDLGGEFGGISLLPDKQGLETGDLENIEVPSMVHLRGKALGIMKSRSGEFSVATSPIGSLVARFASRSERKQDVVLPFPLTLADEWVVKLPAGSPVKHAPEPVKITSPFGSYEVQVEQSAGKILVKAKLSIEKKRIPVENYAEFRAFCEKVDRALEDRLVVGK